MPVIAYIGLGSNVGDKPGNCRRAIELLSRAGRVLRCSSFYRTEPVGNEDQDEFINAVAELETTLEPGALLDACHAIEDELGRSRTMRWGPRTIDLDLLLYADEVIATPQFVVPHPLLAERAFVLVPLCEIASEKKHPVLGRTFAQILQELKDVHKVVRED